MWSTPASEALRAAAIVEQLRAEPLARKRQRRLDALAAMWSRPESPSCAMPACRVDATTEAADVVARYLDDREPEVRRAAAAALRAAGKSTEATRRALCAALRDACPVVRILAALTLARVRDTLGAREHAELRRALGDPTWTVRWYAAVALCRADVQGAAVATLAASVPASPLALGRWLGALSAMSWAVPLAPALLDKMHRDLAAHAPLRDVAQHTANLLAAPR